MRNIYYLLFFILVSFCQSENPKEIVDRKCFPEKINEKYRIDFCLNARKDELKKKVNSFEKSWLKDNYVGHSKIIELQGKKVSYCYAFNFNNNGELDTFQINSGNTCAVDYYEIWKADLINLIDIFKSFEKIDSSFKNSFAFKDGHYENNYNGIKYLLIISFPDSTKPKSGRPYFGYALFAAENGKK